MDFTYSDIEKDHEQLMKDLAVPCRSNKSGFVFRETDRIDVIREKLLGTPYSEILLPCTQLWRRDFSAPIDLIISAHVDTVSNITRCSSELNEHGYYHGTYDNQGPDTALLIAMLEGRLPDNVLVAFNGEEETGRCYGAKQALEYARANGYEPICMALDVTEEGYSKGQLFTVENLYNGANKEIDFEFLEKIGNVGLSLENGCERTFSYVPLKKKAVPDNIPSKYVSKDTGWFDEAQSYVSQEAAAFSLCLPFDGAMHSNSGGDVRQPSFEGYINAIQGFSHTLARGNLEIIPTLAIQNSSFFSTAQQMLEEEKEKESERRKYYTYSSPRYSSSSQSMSEAEWREMMDYNASYGYDGDYEVAQFPEFDKDFYDGIDDYVDCIIEEVYEMAEGYMDYEMKDTFIEDMYAMLPESPAKQEDIKSIFSQIWEEVFESYSMEFEDNYGYRPKNYEDLESVYKKLDAWEAEQEASKLDEEDYSDYSGLS